MARVKIKELRLRNFRAFENARFVLDDKLTVVIGRNGSGKSTLMEAFEFMRDALSDSLVNALDKRGWGLGIAKRRPALPTLEFIDVAFDIVMEVDEITVSYGFSLSLNDIVYARHSPLVREEILLTSNKTNQFRRNEKGFYTDAESIKPSISGDSLALPLLAGGVELWEIIIDTLRQMRTYKLSPLEIGKEQKATGAGWLNQDGSNASDVLNQLQNNATQEGSDSIKWIKEHLSLITNGVTDVAAAQSRTGRSIVFTQQNGYRNIFTAEQMSDGTLRALGILLALRQEPSASLVFIDEIEDSIDTGALSVILDAISASTDRMQVVISSHNTDLLDRDLIRAEYVRVIEWHNGTSTIHNLSENMIKAIDGPYEDVLQPGEASYSVGELLRINALYTDDEPSLVESDKFFEVLK